MLCIRLFLACVNRLRRSATINALLTHNSSIAIRPAASRAVDHWLVVQQDCEARTGTYVLPHGTRDKVVSELKATAGKRVGGLGRTIEDGARLKCTRIASWLLRGRSVNGRKKTSCITIEDRHLWSNLTDDYLQ